MKPFTNYSRIMLSIVLLLLVIIGGFNWYYDPYEIYHFPDNDLTAIEKPALETHLRLHKAYAVKKIRPDSILIGTSRVLVGMDPHNAVLPAGHWYNLALTGASIYEILRYIQHANAARPLKTIVLDVEYGSFDPYLHHKPDFDEARLAVDRQGHANPVFLKDYLRTLFSYDALKDSLALAAGPGNLLQPILGDGSRENDFRSVAQAGGHRALVDGISERLLKIYHQRQQHPIDIEQKRADLYLAYEQILRLAHRKGINLVMFVPPTHAVYLEIRKMAGLWQDFKDWREKIVEINNRVARETGQPPFPIWDFSGFNEYTEEEVPAEGELREMNWYWESSHFKKQLGNIIFRRMFAQHSADAGFSGGFGTLLDLNTVPLTNSRLDEEEKNYSLSHKGEISHLRKILGHINQSDTAL